MNIGEAEIAATKSINEFCMIQAEQVKHRYSHDLRRTINLVEVWKGSWLSY